MSILVAYGSLAVFGYFSALEDTPQLIPNREPAESISNDWVMVLAKIMIITTIIFSVPFLFLLLRKTFNITIRKSNDEPRLLV